MKIMLSLVQESESEFVCDGVRDMLLEMISSRAEFNKLARKKGSSKNNTPGTRGWSRLHDQTLTVQKNHEKKQFFSRKKIKIT